MSICTNTYLKGRYITGCIPTQQDYENFIDSAGGTWQGFDGTLAIRAKNEGVVAGDARGNYSVDLQTERGNSYEVASGAYSSVLGGKNNQACGDGSAVVGGYNNVIGAQNSFIGGGVSNNVTGGYSVIVGGGGTIIGCGNSIVSDWGFIGGGRCNYITSGCGNSILGGMENIIDGSFSSISGGGTYLGCGCGEYGNCIIGSYSFIGGGLSNAIIGNSNYIISGVTNSINASYSGIGGGNLNIIACGGNYNSILGGYANCVSGVCHNYVIGECNNSGSTNLRTSISGFSNEIYASNSHIIGNINAICDGGSYAIGCGNSIKLQASYVFGYSNNVCGPAAGGCGDSPLGGNFVVGNSNTLSCETYNVGVIGSLNNIGCGTVGTYIFGWCNSTGACGGGANGSTILGNKIYADHHNVIMINDGASDLSSYCGCTFNVKAVNGTFIYTNSGSSAGVCLAPGATAWDVFSDMNIKENVTPINYEEILEKVNNMPVSEWNLISQPDSVRHIGPMAQDFNHYFGFGSSCRHINTLDADGVLFASVKGLKCQLDRLSEKVENLASKIE